MIKTGGSEFVCEDCIAERNGMGHLKLLMNDSNTEKVDDEPHKNQDKEVENDQNIASEPNKQSGDEPTEQITTTGSTSADIHKQNDQLNPNIASKESITCEKCLSKGDELIELKEHLIALQKENKEKDKNILEKENIIEDKDKKEKECLEEIEKLKTSNKDFDRIKFLYEKAKTDQKKLETKYQNEINQVKAQKLAADEKYDQAVRETERLRANENVLMKIYKTIL